MHRFFQMNNNGGGQPGTPQTPVPSQFSNPPIGGSGGYAQNPAIAPSPSYSASTPLQPQVQQSQPPQIQPQQAQPSQPPMPLQSPSIAVPPSPHMGPSGASTPVHGAQPSGFNASSASASGSYANGGGGSALPQVPSKKVNFYTDDIWSDSSKLERELQNASIADRGTKDLMCQFCQKTFVEPVLFKCLHTFCRACAHKMRKLNTRSDTDVPCITCGVLTPLDDTGVDGLTLNTPIAQMVSLFNSAKKPCDNCQNPNNARAVFCEQCNASLCTSCNTKIHNLAVFKSHQTIPVLEKKEPVRMCEVHPGERISLFDLEEQTPVCPYCVLTGGRHRNHQCVSIADAGRRLRESITGLIARSQEKESKLTSAFVGLSNAQASVDQAAMDVGQQLVMRFAEMHGILQAREQQLLEKLEMIKQTKFSKLSDQVQEMQNLVQQVNDSWTVSQRLLQHCSDLDVLRLRRCLESRLSDMISAPVDAVPRADAAFKCTLPDDLHHALGSYGDIE